MPRRMARWTPSFDTCHAITFLCDNGAELLLHVGLDTVQLKGKHFQPQVASGDRVKKGQLLLQVDLEAVKRDGYGPRDTGDRYQRGRIARGKSGAGQGEGRGCHYEEQPVKIPRMTYSQNELMVFIPYSYILQLFTDLVQMCMRG